MLLFMITVFLEQMLISYQVDELSVNMQEVAFSSVRI